MHWVSFNYKLQRVLNRYLVSNSHITVVDVDRDIKLYGVSEPLLQGIKVAVRGYQTELHPMITANLTNLQLFIDILYDNGLTFLHTKTKDENVQLHLNYIKINHLKIRRSLPSSYILKEFYDAFVPETLESPSSMVIMISTLTALIMPICHPIHIFTLNMNTFL